MDWIGSGDSLRYRGTDDARLAKEQQTKFFCPGCKTIIQGLRPFSRHRSDDCPDFWTWLDEFWPNRRVKRRAAVGSVDIELEGLAISGTGDEEN